MMLEAARNPVLRTPASVGLEFESVTFEAADGVDLRGWFIPAKPAENQKSMRRPVVVWVHGWMWNRIGNVAGNVPFVDRDVDFLPPTRALHDAGLHVLLFDVSNHGESGSRIPATYGPWEARDYVGAINYLRTRPDVDGNRIGVIGTSAGANIALYGTPLCQPIKAILAIQPNIQRNFNRNFARRELGPLGPALAKSTDLLYLLIGAPLPSRHDPVIPARQLGNTLVRYVQGTGDPWGTMEDVEAMQAATPNTLPVVRFPSAGRYEGYHYISERVSDVVDFFTANL
jgi:uncharacterized protein